jgi:thiol-disulfide isomerase/thioredoxin
MNSTLENAADRPLPRSAALQAQILIGLLVAFAIGVVAWPTHHETASQGGFLVDGDGRAVTLGTRLAPVTLLHFWATWCPPCTAEAPSLSRLASDFANRHDFSIVMVAVEDSRDRVSAFMGPSGAQSVLYDQRWDVAHRYGSEKLPETYLLVNGQVVRKFVGQTDWDDRGVRADLNSHLSSAAPRSADRGGV